MSVIFRHIQAPLFIKVANNCLSNIRAILQENHLNFERPLIISSQNILELGGKQVTKDFKEEAIVIAEDNSIAEAEKIISQINNNDVIISVGGGKILDLGKYIATKTKLNYISVPTTPSNDGLASPIAVLKNEKGLTESIGVNMPMGVLVDLELIKQAPDQNIIAGIGDLISNFSALADWQLAYEQKKEKIDDFAASLAYSAADLIYGHYKNQQTIDIKEKKFLKTLVNGLILSGVAMDIAGSSRPCSGAEHEISHAIDKLFGSKALHGHQVAYGTLIAEKLRGNDYQNFYNFFQAVGLPTSYQELNLNESEITQAILEAPKTRPDRYTILEKINLDKNKIKQVINGL